jgi:phage-related protein
MTLGVADVNNIVLANIGGMPQTPATTTLVEGKVVTPQISTLCSLGNAISHLFEAIKAALAAFMNGIDNLIINPLKQFATACLQAINALLSKISAAIAAASAALRAALQTVLNALNAAITSITNIISHIASLLGEKLQQLLASLTMCAPASVGAKQYGKDDVASSFEQKQPILDIQDQATVIDSIVSDPNMTDDAKIAALNAVSGTVTTNSTTLDTAVTNDQNNLAAAQLQAQGLGKMTTLAAALNNPLTADFATTIINPASSDMITGIADAMSAKTVRVFA